MHIPEQKIWLGGEQNFRLRLMKNADWFLAGPLCDGHLGEVGGPLD